MEHSRKAPAHLLCSPLSADIGDSASAPATERPGSESTVQNFATAAIEEPVVGAGDFAICLTTDSRLSTTGTAEPMWTEMLGSSARRPVKLVADTTSADLFLDQRH